MSISEHEARVHSDFEAYEAEVAALKARVAELERERDEVRSALGTLRQAAQNALPLDMTGWGTLLESVPKMGLRLAKAEADASQLREALEKYGDHHPCCDYGDAIASIPCSCGFRTALASTPSAEPTPRDMRVAEAVREACAEQVMRTIVFDAIDVVRPGWHEQKATAARIVRDLDLAAVVAKAVGT